MSDLRELYQTVILDHNKNPRNFRTPESANRTARGNNPLCGDKITVHATVEGDRVADVAFEGSGCAISTASASLMTQAVKGLSLDEAEKLFRSFHALLTTDVVAADDAAELGKLAVFSGVREFPIRVKCATLAWHTLRAALAGESDSVSTE